MFFLFAVVFALFAFSTALPQNFPNATAIPTPIAPQSAIATDECFADNFDSAWILTNIVMFTPTEITATNQAHISFEFQDTNEALGLTTHCVAEIVDGDAKTNGQGYVRCENDRIAFQLSGGNEILVLRVFHDAWYVSCPFTSSCFAKGSAHADKNCSLGDPPYDYGIAYGQNTTTMSMSKWGSGIMGFQPELLVPITRMS